jgi:hypothetical protein
VCKVGLLLHFDLLDDLVSLSLFSDFLLFHVGYCLLP